LSFHNRHRRKRENRGDSTIDRRSKPEMQDEGQPKSSIAGVAGGGENHRGNPGACQNQRRRRHEKFGATRADIAGTAEGSKPRGNPKHRTPAQHKGSEVRGNPETQPGRSGKMQDAGQLATSSAGRTGRCMIHRAIRSSGKRQRPQGFWRFRFLDKIFRQIRQT